MFCSEFKGQGNKKLKLCAIRRRKTTQELLMEKDNKNNNLSTSPSLHPPIKTIIRPLTTVFRQTSNSARLLAEIGERKNFGSNRSVGTAVGRLNKETELIEMKSTDRNSGSNQKIQIDAPAADERNCPIKLSVYNIQKQFRIYHVGVLIRGREFHYGMRIGVFTCEPANGQKTFHVKYWRKMIHWRIEFIKCMALLTHFPLTTTMSLEELEKVQRELGQKYMRANYHLLNHNCLDFAREFIRRITTKQPPNWIWPQELRQPLIIMPVRLVFRVEQRKALRKEKQKHDNNSNADGDYASSTLSTTPMVLLRQHVQQQIPYITNIKIKYNGD